MLSDLIYIEELPDIDVIELVSGDEYVDNDGEGDGKIGRNVYVDNDDVDQIYDQLMMLLHLEFPENVKQKANIFKAIHKSLIAERPSIQHHSIPSNIIPEVGIDRKNNGEYDKEFHDEYYVAESISSYERRRHEMHKIFFGFTSVDDDQPSLPPILRPTPVYYLPPEYGVLQSTVLLPADKISPSVNNLYMINGLVQSNPAFYALKLVDKIGATPQTTDMDYATDNNTVLPELVTKIIRKAVDDQLDSIDKVGTLYDLWRTFMEVGVDTNAYIDNAKYMTVDVIAQLRSKLEELRDIDTDIGIEPLKRTTDRAIGSPLKTANDTCSVAGFYQAQKNSFVTLEPGIKDSLMKLCIDVYASLSANEDDPLLPKNAHDIMTMLLKKEVTIKNLIKRIKVRILYQEREFIEDWFERIHEWEPSTVQAKLDTEYALAQKTLKSIFDEANEKWGSIVKEISHIKRGEVISKDYQDDPGAGIRTADDVQIEDTDDFAFEGTDQEESRVPIFDDRIPIDINHLHEGTKEIYKIVLGMFVELQRSSGLPIDYTRLTFALPKKVRKTKTVELREKIARHIDVSSDLLDTLDNATLENITEIIKNNVRDKTKHKSILVAFQTIYNTFLDNIKEMWMHLLGWWVCEIQQHVLNNSLQFNVAWDGSFVCIGTWSPFGYPMENKRNGTKGVLPYLICIIVKLNTTPGSLWLKYSKGITPNDVHNNLHNLYTGLFANRVHSLQTHFLVFDKETGFKGIVERGNKIKETLENTVAQKINTQYISDYMNFLMNLPSILINTSQNKKSSRGCCIQALDENYQADFDWKRIAPSAYKIKISYATKRIGFKSRPILIFPGRVDATPSPPIVAPPPLPPSPTFVNWKLDDMITSLEKYMPVPHFNAFNDKNARSTLSIIQNYLSIFKKTVLEDDAFINFVNNRSTQTLIEATRSLLQIQCHIINTEYTVQSPEYTHLKTKFEDNLDLYDMLLHNARMLDDHYQMRHTRLIQYFFIRQLCFPAKPEHAVNNTLVMKTSESLDASLLKTFLSKSTSRIKSWMVTKDFNTSVNYVKHLTEAREKENASRMAATKSMTPDERGIYKLAKDLGIAEGVKYMNTFRDRLPPVDSNPLPNQGADSDDEDSLSDNDMNSDEEDPNTLD